MDETEQKKIFDRWLQTHKGIFFKIVRAYAFTPADQEDLFQELSLRVWQSIPDFRGESKPSTWIYRVALYTAVAHVRKEKKQPPTRPLSDVAHMLVANPESKDERLDWLYIQIAQLDPIDRSLCLLMLEGFSYKEIATLVGISESNVGVKLHRIKKHLTRQSMATSRRKQHGD